MTFTTDQMEKELEGYVMLAPRLKQELNEAMKDVARPSDRINKILREGTVKSRHHETEPVVRDHVLR